MQVYRPEPNPAPEARIYLPDSCLPEELWKGVDIALLGAAPAGPVLFDGGREDWLPWVSGFFSGTIIPHLAEARRGAEQGVLELLEADRAFTAALERVETGPEAVSRSRRAGRALLQRNQGARHFQALDKLQARIEAEESAGHAASVLMFLSVHFNLPVSTGHIACLAFEWMGAFAAEDGGFERMTPILGERLPEWFQSSTNNTFQPGSIG